jgi:hypothetical protein
MRLSLGSVALLVAALFVAFAFWPDNHAIPGPSQVLAENKPKSKAETKTPAAAASKREQTSTHTRTPQPTASAPHHAVSEPEIAIEHPLSSDIGRHPRIEAALETKVDFSIEPEPLKDAIDFIAQRYQIPILMDTKVLEDASVDTSAEVKLPYSGMKLRDMLNLLLQQGSQPLSYVIEDSVLRITTVEQVRQYTYVVVYDCRDLIHMTSMYPAAATPQPQSIQSAAAPEQSGTPPESATIAAQFGGKPAAGQNKKAETSAKATCQQDAIPLIRVIKYSIDPNDWVEEEGTAQKITEIGGLLVVNQNALVHEQIKRILADLRRMRKDGAFAAFDHVTSAPVANTTRPARPNGL